MEPGAQAESRRAEAERRFPPGKRGCGESPAATFSGDSSVPALSGQALRGGAGEHLDISWETTQEPAGLCSSLFCWGGF